MSDIVLVKDLIEFLKTHFKDSDKLCYWHEGGAWIECEYVHKSDVGSQFLRKLSEEKESRWKSLSEMRDGYSKEDLEHDYRLIENPDEYVLIY